MATVVRRTKEDDLIIIRLAYEQPRVRCRFEEILNECPSNTRTALGGSLQLRVLPPHLCKKCFLSIFCATTTAEENGWMWREVDLKDR